MAPVKKPKALKSQMQRVAAAVKDLSLKPTIESSTGFGLGSILLTKVAKYGKVREAYKPDVARNLKFTLS